MFGYLKVDTPNMYVKDTVLYKAMYCGLCKGIGSCCGQTARLSLNYDLTFLSVLLHNVCDLDVKIEKSHCIIHPVTKKPIAKCDELTEKIGALNVILAYYKLNDDVLDNGKGKIKRGLLKTSFNKAKKYQPELEKTVKKYFSKLLDYENSQGDSIDVSADFFASLIADCVKILVKENCSDSLYKLSYNLGKWTYLIDAIDDFDKDVKSGNYNVFSLSYKKEKTKNDLIKNNLNDIETVFSCILDEIEKNAKELDYKFNHDLSDNVLLKGIKKETKRILGI